MVAFAVPDELPLPMFGQWWVPDPPLPEPEPELGLVLVEGVGDELAADA